MKKKSAYLIKAVKIGILLQVQREEQNR